MLDYFQKMVYNYYVYICVSPSVTKNRVKERYIVMNFKRLCAAGLSAVLSVMMLTTPVHAAIKLIGAANIYSLPTVGSKVTVGMSLSENEAANRLYFLGMITGSGTNVNGSIDFGLNRGLNRLDSTVLAVRMLGEEEVALTKKYEHPFTDVPDWGSPYVGYIYHCGLLGDIQGTEFQPKEPENLNRFMSYMLYALGYRIDKSDYSTPVAADYSRGIGICHIDNDEPLTRGKAFLAMYDTLRSTVKDSGRVCSDVLVEKGAISYQDAVFLLWSYSQEETDEYLRAVGYNCQWIIPNGLYKITSTSNDQLLNAAFDGMDNDYEGVGVTLWQDTSDITQTFRLERTARGTYYIYSAASRHGWGRVIGANNAGSAGLYGSTTQNAMEFYINGSADGTWQIISAKDSTMYLCSEAEAKNGAAVKLDNSEKAKNQHWTFERQGVLNENGEELAIFVSESLLVTQGAFDTYSHQKQNALDIVPIEGAIRAPFNATVIRLHPTYNACNAVWIQSTNKVRFADGSYDYMTACFLHDDDISDLYVGMPLIQGEYFYDSGTFGVSSGKHVHMSVYRGQYNTSMRIGSGTLNVEDALFIPNDTYIYQPYGLEWNLISYTPASK